MARDKGRRPGGRPPMRPAPTIDLKATEVTTDFAASEHAVNQSERLGVALM